VKVTNGAPIYWPRHRVHEHEEIAALRSTPNPSPCAHSPRSVLPNQNESYPSRAATESHQPSAMTDFTSGKRM
jgi:hypothetical protein